MLRDSMTLGERCVAWCREEMARENPPTLATVARYAEHCQRGGNGIGAWLAGRLLAGHRYNHCAMAISEAARVCGGTETHGHRAGALEIMRDAIAAGAWHQASEAVDGTWRPSVGDVAVYDRSKPGRPETNGWGHVDRVTEPITGESYGNIGANEGYAPPGHGGAWRVQVSRYDGARLLGFVSYAREAPVEIMTPAEVEATEIYPPDMLTPEAMWWDDYDAEKLARFQDG